MLPIVLTISTDMRADVRVIAYRFVCISLQIVCSFLHFLYLFFGAGISLDQSIFSNFFVDVCAFVSALFLVGVFMTLACFVVDVIVFTSCLSSCVFCDWFADMFAAFCLHNLPLCL